ncbi:MAG: hypothetical protein U0Q18_01410 [Bryobacteraceae bacterium]
MNRQTRGIVIEAGLLFDYQNPSSTSAGLVSRTAILSLVRLPTGFVYLALHRHRLTISLDLRQAQFITARAITAGELLNETIVTIKPFVPADAFSQAFLGPWEKD